LTAQSDAETLLREPPDDVILLNDGKIRARVVRIRTRELLKLMKVITHGAGNALGSVVQAMQGAETDDFANQLIALLVVAIPDAEDETIELLQALAIPEGITPNPTKAQALENATLATELLLHLQNPPIEDTIAIITQVIENEAGDIQALGKQLATTLETAQKVGLTSRI
jgi:hypothetical protein